MEDIILVIVMGSLLFLLLGCFSTFAVFLYQRKRLRHRAEVQSLQEAYRHEVLKARLEVQEQTAAHIAGELHDNIGQLLTLARLYLTNRNAAGTISQKEKIKLGQELLDQALQDLRDVTKQLNADFVNKRPFSELVKFQLELIGKTGMLETAFELKGQEKSLEAEKKLVLFRMVQELLHNTLRHAEARKLVVRLHYQPDALQLTVQDNGKGFRVQKPAAKPLAETGIGTSTMHYRAQMIGAALHLESEPGKGTLARIMLHI